MKAKVAESGLDLAKVAGSEDKVEEFLKEKVRSRNGCRYILFILDGISGFLFFGTLERNLFSLTCSDLF